MSNDATSGNKDDGIIDDWEQLDQQTIQKSLQTIKLNSQLNSSQNEEKIFSNLNSNTQSATATAPLGPTIKILKRPQSNKNLLEGNNNNSANSGQTQSNASQSIKTFEQREQEYAQARLRILGSAHPEQDHQTSSSSFSTSRGAAGNNTTSPTTAVNNPYPKVQNFNKGYKS